MWGSRPPSDHAERALYTEHYSANDIEAASWGGDRTVLPLVAAHHLDRPPARPAWVPGLGLLVRRSDQPERRGAAG